jgi:hypothetical protein
VNNIRVHVERLVLEGLPVSASERPLLQAAMEAELIRLLGNGELAGELRAGAALTEVRAGAVLAVKESSPERLGADIARAVHQGLGHSSRRQSVKGSHRQSAASRQPLPGNRR